jgi:hypothetical protein
MLRDKIRRSTLELLALTIFTILVLFLRRPDQFLHPYIWIEDGWFNLRTFANHGAYVLVEPVSGYEIFATKLISYIAFSISILWAPEIETVLMVLMTCAVIIAIARSPTHLPTPFLCAIAVLLIPSDAEVFAVSAYANWWAGLLLLLPPIWRQESQYVKNFFIVFGGLSTPLIFPATLALLVRCAIDRTRSDVVSALVAVAISASQLLVLRSMGGIEQRTLDVETVRLAIDKFGGFFFVGAFTFDNTSYAGLGFFIFLVLTIVAWMSRAKFDRYFGLLVFMYAIICATVAARGPMVHLHPFVGGPRYFFYPFVLMMWISIWIAMASGIVVRAAMCAALAFALIAAGSQLSRRHDVFDWRANLKACALSDHYTLPIQFNRTREDALRASPVMTGEECRKLLARSFF